MNNYWRNFNTGNWCQNINVEEFIRLNYKKYLGDESFLSSTTDKTNKVWDKCQTLLQEELKKGVLDIEVNKMSGINAFEAGYIDKDNEVIVGLQTDEPLKRIVNPYGGIRMVYSELEAYGYEMNPIIDKYLKEFRKTHNDGVFDAYTPEIRKARSVGLLTGLPDAYGRGRIIGDYRRIALYGIDFLIEQKENDFNNNYKNINEETIRVREEISMQIKALKEIKEMALKYGYDISKPAENGIEAVQWTYFGYLAGVKENNGAAMSMGRIDGFFDIYFERDLEEGRITEEEIQEAIDQFVIKLRLVRHLRTPEYDELFTGDPTWVTCVIGGMLNDNETLVTKTSYRLIHTLRNLDPAPEPNMTILWSENLPETFKKYSAKMSIETDSIQYENDDLMRPIYGNDYAIACCVSAMRLGKDMQFFGARCNLAKSLLYAINGGVDEVKKSKVLENIETIDDEILEYDKVLNNYFKVLENVAKIYSDAMNIIHFMHDKYAYEAALMALHDSVVHRYMAYGVAGLSVVADSLSAIKYAKVKPIREDGITTDFVIEGDFPKYGNDDDRVDEIAKLILNKFHDELEKNWTYRNAEVTMSVLTITSNVVYGSKTGATPDGRKAGVAFAPGANPMHERDMNGAVASLNSVAKLEYENCCKDGISNTFTIIPDALGKDKDEQIKNLVTLLNGYFKQKAHHLNVNVLNRETLVDAMEHPEKYPLLTIRVSGYAVRFNRLTKKQQLEVISRTFHESL
ncbi:MAG: formate C-acetyltransferase [Firmicutes bacterium]|nr:formate C-acetyltransferase [Bacillota bacterium]